MLAWSVLLHQCEALPYWGSIIPALAEYGIDVQAGQMDLWLLTLAARGIPYQMVYGSHGISIYVPVFLVRVAACEIGHVERENRPGQQEAHLPTPYGSVATPWLLLCLVLWHGVRMRWWPQLNALLPDALETLSAAQWADAGRMDGLRVLMDGEWYRTVTALTLHADSRHLFGNIALGSVVMSLLCRRVGSDVGWVLALGAGVLGNMCSVLIAGPIYQSIGASTGVFGGVGVLCGMVWAAEGYRRERSQWTIFATGMGVLAMLGMEGERVDSTAHIAGLLCGGILGGCAGMLPAIHARYHGLKVPDTRMAGVLGILIFVALAWRLAV